MDKLFQTHLDKPIRLDIVLKPTDQIVGAYLESAEVTTINQRGLHRYNYFAIWKMGLYQCRLEADSNQFIDDPDELQKLEWSLLNGELIPKIFNRSWIERT